MISHLKYFVFFILIFNIGCVLICGDTDKNPDFTTKVIEKENDKNIYQLIFLESRSDSDFIYIYYGYASLTLSNSDNEYFPMFQRIDFDTNLSEIDRNIYTELRKDNIISLKLNQYDLFAFVNYYTSAGTKDILVEDDLGTEKYFLKDGVFQEPVYWSPDIKVIYHNSPKHLHYFIHKDLMISSR